MYILETERLAFRRLLPADLHSLFTLYGNPDVRRYYPEGTLSLEETREELEWFLGGHPQHPELGLWATLLKATGEFIGRCGLLPWTIEGRFEVEVAYMLAPSFWGRGLGTEAARGILRYGFETLKLPRLICLIDRDNLASQKVAANIGMVFEKEVQDDQGWAQMYAVSNPGSA